jgi:hypothetical protein
VSDEHATLYWGATDDWMIYDTDTGEVFFGDSGWGAVFTWLAWITGTPPTGT